MSERYRAKLRDRNLGRVPVQTYPSDGRRGSIGSIRDPQTRLRAKMENHSVSGRSQDDAAPMTGDESGKGSPEPAQAGAADKPKPRKGDESGKG